MSTPEGRLLHALFTGELPMSTPEGRVKVLIKQVIGGRFPHAYRFMPVQNGMGAPGLDFYYCIRGLFIAIEAKAPGKCVTERQRETMHQITVAGGHSFVIDGPETCEEALRAIYRVLGEKP